MTWRDHAACLGLDTDLFYRHERTTGAPARRAAEPALAICDACPVRADCLQAALDEPGPQHGIRGGLRAKERTAMVLARRAS